MTATPHTGSTITHPHELEALPVGSWIGLVRNGTFRPYEKHDDDTWLTPQGGYLDDDWLPATVLHNPDEPDTLPATTPPALPPAVQDQAAAIARVREFVRQFNHLRDTGGRIHSVYSDPDANEGADLTVTDLETLLSLLASDETTMALALLNSPGRTLFTNELAAKTDRLRHLYANAVAWDMSDHADRPDLRLQREKYYAQFDEWHAQVKAEAADRALRTNQS